MRKCSNGMCRTGVVPLTSFKTANDTFILFSVGNYHVGMCLEDLSSQPRCLGWLWSYVSLI